MKKTMDKLLNKIKINKKIFVFLLVLSTVALISGSILVVMLDKTDKTTITSYLNEFITNIEQNKIEYIGVFKSTLITNIFLVLSIWLLGISVIGLPIIVFLYFAQIFTFGFALASIILKFKLKGTIFAFIYTFPSYLIYIFVLLILTSYALLLSLKFINTILKKKQIDFKPIFNRYGLILVISLIITCITSLYEVFVFPNIIKLIVPILK
ncbi:MAG: stage II sporulation protein M [Firmicutes bacterium]|nr:stage II sporulation protein M [Bacillota bacterium]